MEALPDGAGERKKLAVTVKLNRLARGVKNHLTMLAHLQVCFEVPLQFLVNVPVQVIRNISDCFLAAQNGYSLLKILLSSSRSCRRARKSRAFTALTVRLSALAVSSVERPSTSRKKNAVR